MSREIEFCDTLPQTLLGKVALGEDSQESLKIFTESEYDKIVMLGYVTIEKGELKVREYERYQAYYCGICRSIGRRLGQTPRMTLSYDAAFLAAVLAGAFSEEAQIVRRHCMVHPVQKRPQVERSGAVDYAADVMVILAYYKFLDDCADEGGVLAHGGRAALSCAYRKLKKRYGDLCRGIEEDLLQLSRLEDACSGNLDLTAGAFAKIMERLFTGYKGNEAEKRILAALGRALGKWIYLADALDDYQKDCEKNRYNPFRYRKNGLEGIEDLLYNILAEIASACDLLNLGANRGIIENIIFMGIRSGTDRILRERTEQNEQSI